MNILLCNTYHFLGGGDSTYTFNLATLLRNRGHEVSFFAMQDDRNLPDPNSDLFVSHINFRELNRNKNLVSGYQVLARSIYSTEARKKFSCLLDRVQPDIVHLQSIHAHITPSVILEAKKRGLPVVWTLHNYKMHCPNGHYLIDTTNEICEACGKGRYYQATVKRCKKGSFLASAAASLEAYVHCMLNVRDHVDIFLSPSCFLRNKSIRYGIPEEKIVHLTNFIPEEAFENYQGEHQGYFLFLGRLVAIKGVAVLVEAARSCPEAQIILAGRAEPGFLKSLQPLPSNMEYVGVKSGAELRKLLANALAIIVPSLWYENQPFSILEAFGMGKSVIASDLGGMTELVVHGERGLLFTPGSAAELAEAMKNMLSNTKEIHAFGENAFHYAHKYYSENYHYEMLTNIYKELMKR